MKLDYPEQAPSLEKVLHKTPRPKLQPAKVIEEPVADVNNFELLFSPEAPPAPVPPPAPSVSEFASEGFNFNFQFPESETLMKASAAPDPRDRRHPDILRNEQFRKAKEIAGSPEVYRAIQNNAKQFQDMAKLKVNMGKLIEHPEQIYTEKLLADMEENIIAGQGVTITPKIQMERKIAAGKKVARPLIRTIPVENGMTITIIQDEEQIEITLKDKR
jgi:hypothetical protein